VYLGQALAVGPSISMVARMCMTRGLDPIQLGAAGVLQIERVPGPERFAVDVEIRWSSAFLIQLQ
jgi:hypothetical protein